MEQKPGVSITLGSLSKQKTIDMLNIIQTMSEAISGKLTQEKMNSFIKKVTQKDGKYEVIIKVQQI